MDTLASSRPACTAGRALKRARLYELNAARRTLVKRAAVATGLGLVLAVGNSSTLECRHRSIDQQREGGPSRSLGGKPRGGVRTVNCEVQITVFVM